MQMVNYRETEEASPQLCLPVIKKLRLCFHQSREEITMAVLILAPVLEVFENRITYELRVGLEMPVYGNVPPVSNFLRQVSCIEDELWLEESVFSCFRQEPQVQRQIEIRQTLVQKPAKSQTAKPSQYS